MNVEYVTDSAGHPISVIVPIDLWRKILRKETVTENVMQTSTAFIRQTPKADLWQWMGIYQGDEQFDQAISELNQAWQHWSATLSA